MNKLVDFIRRLFEDNLESIVGDLTEKVDRLRAFEENANLRYAEINQQITDLALEAGKVKVSGQRSARIRERINTLIDAELP